MKIRCATFFDITETGITGHYKQSQVPFKDYTGADIVNQDTWNTARNKQRNFETITQVLQLRTQIFDVSRPEKQNKKWTFEFDIEFEGIYESNNDPFGTLKQDCDSVPMIVGLGDEFTLSPFLVTDGTQQNIWFELIPVNT